MAIGKYAENGFSLMNSLHVTFYQRSKMGLWPYITHLNVRRPTSVIVTGDVGLEIAMPLIAICS